MDKYRLRSKAYHWLVGLFLVLILLLITIPLLMRSWDGT